MNGLSVRGDEENSSLRMRHWLAPAFLPADRISGAFSVEKPAKPGYLEDSHIQKGSDATSHCGAVCKPVPSDNECRIRVCV